MLCLWVINEVCSLLIVSTCYPIGTFYLFQFYQTIDNPWEGFQNSCKSASLNKTLKLPVFKIFFFLHYYHYQGLSKSSHLLIPSPKFCNNLTYARFKPRSRNLTHTSHVGSRDPTAEAITFPSMEGYVIGCYNQERDSEIKPMELWHETRMF